MYKICQKKGGTENSDICLSVYSCGKITHFNSCLKCHMKGKAFLQTRVIFELQIMSLPSVRAVGVAKLMC